MASNQMSLKNDSENFKIIIIATICFVIVNPLVFIDLGGDTSDAIRIKTPVEPQIDSERMSGENRGFINYANELETFTPPSTPNGSFQYPGGSTIIALAHAQTEQELRQAYKAIFSRIYESSDIEIVMDSFNSEGTDFPAGTMATVGGFSGPFNTTPAKEPFNITKAYSLHPSKIAVFRSEILDSYGQPISWEEGYFERIFRVYLWGDYFTPVNESQIWNDELKTGGYDMLIFPSVIKGYESSVETKLGSKGLAKIRQFVNLGGTIYAQGGMCRIPEAAWVVPNGTVLMDTRIDSFNNCADIEAVNTSTIMTKNWLSERMYLINDPVLNATEPGAVIAKYTGNLTNSSLVNTSAILYFEYGNGQVILTNGHPSVKGEYYPVVLNAVMQAMAETSDLRATARQTYTDEVPPSLIPAQEPGIPVEVEITYMNFWPVSGQRTVNVTEILSSLFYLDNTTVAPEAEYLLNLSNNETEISWEFKDHQGLEKFKFVARTYPNTTKQGDVTVSCGKAIFTPPEYRGRTEINHPCTSIKAALAARLVGDRDIELDGCYPLPAEGFYYDIAMPLENKEETTAKNITITDIVILKSPIVDVENQTRVPDAVNNSNNGTSDIVFAVNEIFYYYDKYGKPLYPMPDETYNTTYNYTFGNNGTNITLPAKKLVWHYPNIIPFDYQEPAIRYGIFTHEENNRTVSFLSSPVAGSVLLNASGGSVFTNLGIHPIPYHEYLSHGVITIPVGDEIPRVEYKDIWNRNHTMELRTVFYDIVPFPPPEEHAVVTTTYEMTSNGQRLLEFPIHKEVELNFTIRTWNGYGIYNETDYPYHMDLHKNETMIVQALPRGVGYNIDYIKSIFDDNTTLLMIENTSTHTILYFQQYIEGGHKETINVRANLSAYPQVHREGAMKINDGARFVYHQIAVGPSRYEVFDSHVQAVFGIGNDVQVDKRVAPVYIATFGDDVYHFIEIEDPYEPREFLEDPYIKSYGFGNMTATTYVGGRIKDRIHQSRVDPGDRTLIRLEVDNNLGHDLNNVTISPVAPAGFTVTPDNFTTQIPPIFYDFPFINRTDIWDAWKSVYYWWVDVDSDVVGGEVYQINFTLKCSSANATYIPEDFEIPPALIGVKDANGHVEAIFGRALDLKLMDAVPSYVNPEYVAIANVAEKDAFELNIAVGVSNPGSYNRSEVNDTFQVFRPVNFTTSGGDVKIQLPPYASVMPWIDNGTDAKTLFVILKTNVTVTRGGTYPVNEGPDVSYTNHFNETVNVSSGGEYVEAHGPAFNYFMNVHSIECEKVEHNYLTREANNTVITKINVFNYGDGIAESSVIMVRYPSTSILDTSKLPANAYSKSNTVYWTTGDIGPGSEHSFFLTFFTTPPADTSTGPDRGPPEPWLMIDNCRVSFVNGFLKKSVTVPPSGPLYAQFFGIDMVLEQISFSHPFASTNEPHKIYAEVNSDWPFSEPIYNVKVNFTINDVYIGTSTLGKLLPGNHGLAGLSFTFTDEGTYSVKAEIIQPKLNEFYDYNNAAETTITVVDPVSVTSNPDYGTGIDSYIASGDSTFNFGDSETLKVGRFYGAGGSGTGSGITRSLVKIDMSGIPSNSMVLDAKIKLYLYKSTGGTLPVTAFAVGRTWSEDSVKWDNKPYEYPDRLDTIDVDTSAGFKSWNITPAVQRWISDPQSNFGMMLISDYENTYWSKEFYSSDSETDYKPVLFVRYAMLKYSPDISYAQPSVDDYRDRELRIEWTPVPYALYYEVYRSDSETGPFVKLGTTWSSASQGFNGSLDTYFYDDLDGGYPEAPTVIATDRGNMAGTIRVYWNAPADPAPSASYYYRVKAFGIEGKESGMTPPLKGQLTPAIAKYYLYNSTTSSGPWTEILGETDDTYFLHSNLGIGKVMYYRIMSESSEGFCSPLSKVVWGRSNRLPVISNPYISPDPATTINHLYAKFYFSDPDGDTESGSKVRWYRNGVLVSAFNDHKYVYYWWTKKDEIWNFTITAKDGIEYGNTLKSGPIIIQNSAPYLTSVWLSPASPRTTDALTINYKYNDYDKDPETAREIRWYKNGVHQPVHDGKTVLPSGSTGKSDVWNVSIRVSDGTVYSANVNPASRTILNTVPVAVDVRIIPESPTTDDSLTASYSFTDADNDPEAGTDIYWYKGDTLQTAYNNRKQLPSSATAKGEEWYFTVTPRDGEQAGLKVISPKVKIGNAQPVVSGLKIYPEVPRTTDDLSVWYKYFDPDGDPESGTVIKWYRNEIYLPQYSNHATIPRGETRRGDSWQVLVSPKDGFEHGLSYYSDSIIILNSAPVINSAKIVPENPALSDELGFEFEITDADSDIVSLFAVSWFVNDDVQTALNDSLKVAPELTSAGDVWYFELAVFDGIDYSEIFKSGVVKINTPPSAQDVHISPSYASGTDTLKANYRWTDLDETDSEIDTVISWYRDGLIVNSLTGSLEVPHTGINKGELWFFTVLPFDGKDFGELAVSPPVEIKNTAPSVSEVKIVPYEPRADGNISASYKYFDSDGDPEIGTEIRWYRNNEIVHEIDDAKTVEPDLLIAGDSWFFTVQPGDGEALGIPVTSEPVTIDEPRIRIQKAVIKPAQPVTTDILYAEVELSAQGQDAVIEYRWFRNDNSVPELNDKTLVDPEYTMKGERWYFEITIVDDDMRTTRKSPVMIIANSHPEVTGVRILPQEPVQFKELSLKYSFVDPDEDAESGTEIRWFRNREEVVDLFGRVSVPIIYLEPGDEWYASIKPMDGTASGQEITTAIAKINTPPGINGYGIFPANPEPTEPLTIKYEYSDGDGDLEAQTSIQWYRDGVHLAYLNGLKVVPADATSAGEKWHAVIQPHDGKEYGQSYECSSVIIGDAETEDGVQDISEDAAWSTMTILTVLAIILVVIMMLLFILIRRSKLLRRTTKDSIDQILTIEAAEALSEKRVTLNEAGKMYSAEPVISKEYFTDEKPEEPKYLKEAYLMSLDGADPCKSCDSETYGDLQRCASCFIENQEFVIED